MTKCHAAPRVSGSERYGIRLLFRHPETDPNTITDVLGLTPSHAWMAGAARKTPAGTALAGFYRDSMWSHSYTVVRQRSFSKDITHMLDIIEPHSSFLLQLAATGGSQKLIVDLPGNVNIGGEIQLSDIARLLALNLSLSFEVFPNFPSLE